MVGTVKTRRDIDTPTRVGLGVDPRDTVDGADDTDREVRVERDRSAPRTGTDQQRNAAITPTSSARELITLAERMGIPTGDAVHRVLKHLSEQHLVVEKDSVVRTGWVRPWPRPPST